MAFKAVLDACVLYPFSLRDFLLRLAEAENDPGDRHVLAAAVVADADAVITSNLRHFPFAATSPLGVEAFSPDDFLCTLLSQDPASVREVLFRQAESLSNPAISIDELIAMIGRAGASEFAAKIRH